MGENAIMNNNGNKNITDDLLSVLLALKSNINKELNVAEVCKITSINSDGTICCNTLNNNLVLKTLPLKGLTLNLGDNVVVLFTNTDYRTLLTNTVNNQTSSNATQEVEYHSKSFGIIIGKI